MEKTREKTGAEAFTDLDEMFSSSDADCVIITTPNGLHAEHSIKAAKSGFDVITEKPMAINVKDAERMIKTFQELNKKLFVVKQVRFSQSIQMIKKALEEKKDSVKFI